jgi:hypothetical protein
MRLIVTLLALISFLSACVSREVEHRTVVEQPRANSVEVVPGPQGPPGPPGPPGDTTVVVPRR